MQASSLGDRDIEMGQMPGDDVQVELNPENGTEREPTTTLVTNEEKKRGCLATIMRKQRSVCVPAGCTAAVILLISAIGVAALGAIALSFSRGGKHGDDVNIPAVLGGAGALSGGALLAAAAFVICCLTGGVWHYAGDKKLRDLLTKQQEQLTALGKEMDRQIAELEREKTLVLREREQALGERQVQSQFLTNYNEKLKSEIDRDRVANGEVLNDLEKAQQELIDLRDQYQELQKVNEELQKQLSLAIADVEQVNNTSSAAEKRSGEELSKIESMLLQSEALINQMQSRNLETEEISNLFNIQKETLERMNSLRNIHTKKLEEHETISLKLKQLSEKRAETSQELDAIERRLGIGSSTNEDV